MKTLNAALRGKSPISIRFFLQTRWVSYRPSAAVRHCDRHLL